jgi:hypothetical protein
MRPREFQIAVIASAITLILFRLLFNGMSARGAGQSVSIEPLDARQTITYFISDGAGVPGYRSSDRQLAEWALQTWQRTSPKALRFEPAPESDAVVRLYWAGPETGQFGEMRSLQVGKRRGAAVFIRPDLPSLGPEIDRRATSDDLLRDTVVYLTCVHELGHAMGLEHTRNFADIMYYFGYGGDVAEFFGRYRALLHTRADIARNPGLSASDVERMKLMYGRE